MATLNITINMDGDALSDHLAALDSHPGMAVAVATDVPNHVRFLSTGGIKDANGNTVGAWTFTDDNGDVIDVT